VKELASGLRSPSVRPALILLLVVTALLLATLGQRTLQSPDEGRYTESAREILESGNWLVPHFAYQERLNKPPLTYWAIAASFRVFGQNEWAGRLPEALAALGGAAVLLVFGGVLWGAEVGVTAAICVLTCGWYALLARSAITDMPLCFFLTLTIAAFYWALSTGRWQAYLVFFVAAAGGTLVKGPLAVGLPVIVGSVYLILSRRWKDVRWGWVAAGILVYAVLAVPWFAAVQARYPNFLRYTFVSENVQRFAGKYHEEPFYFYVPVLLLGLTAWLLPAGTAALADWSGVRKRAAAWQTDPAVLFLWVWFGVIFLFFTASKAKLPSYVLPCFPPLALIIARTWATGRPLACRRALWGTTILLGLAALGGIAIAFFIKISALSGHERHGGGLWLAGTSLAAVGACVWGLRRSGRAHLALAAAAALLTLGLDQGSVYAGQALDAASFARATSAALKADPAARVVMFRSDKLTAFRFYLGRELGSARRIEDLPPLEQEDIYADNAPEETPQKGAAAQSLKPILEKGATVFLLVRRKEYKRLHRSLFPDAPVLARNSEFVLVKPSGGATAPAPADDGNERAD
jgi:4-amino-4-deoxy-L-arabinose transferase-like glycosyltransferase